jgi:hypothetical protein
MKLMNSSKALLSVFIRGLMVVGKMRESVQGGYKMIQNWNTKVTVN